jgi:hypothetical protein
MSAVASNLLFEVRRFAAEAAGADVGLLELEGRFKAPVRRRLGRPTLVAEADGDTLEVRAVAATDAVAEPDGGAWRATFALPVEALGTARFSLAVGRELLLELPSPDAPPEAADGTTDRHVRLAREANAQRRRADEARDAAGAALARADAEHEARERADAEAEAVRLERDDLARRLSSVEAELAALRRESAETSLAQEEARRALEAEHADALAARDAAAARAIEEGVTAAQAEATEARRALKAVRGDLEAARREAERERERADRAAAVVPRGYVAADADPTQTAPTAPVAEADTAPQPGPATAVARDSGARAARLAPADPASAAEGDEAVRVLGARRARRAAPANAEPLPGTAAVGARHIEPGVAGGRSAAAVWLARAVALACIVAVVLVLALLLGLL